MTLPAAGHTTGIRKLGQDCASTKDRHWETSETGQMCWAPPEAQGQLPLVTPLTQKHATKHRKKPKAHVKFLLFHECSDPFLLGAHALSEGIRHFLNCVMVSGTQTLPPLGWKLPDSRITVEFTKGRPWHSNHMWRTATRCPVGSTTVVPKSIYANYTYKYTNVFTNIYI